MKKRYGLILSLVTAFSLGVFACSDDKEDNSKAECTSNADCAGNTESGKIECDLAKKICVLPTILSECTSNADCAGNTESGKIECDLTNKVCVIPQSVDGCTRNDDCDSNLCKDGTCATAKMASCTSLDVVPDNATQNEEAMVEVTFVDGAWTAASPCPWSCNTGYLLNGAKDGCEAPASCTENSDCRSGLCIEDVCATTKLDDCQPWSASELEARHATAQNLTAQVTWTFVESSDGSAEWTTPGHCPLTDCKEDYLLNTSQTECIESVIVMTCTSDEDCEDNTDGKTVCEIPSGDSEGICVEPECATNADCAGNTANGKLYCEQSTHTCVDTCTFDEDCTHDPSKPMCDWADSWTCIAAECQAGACSAGGEYCDNMRWATCPQTGYACDSSSNGTCQLPEQTCSPACTTGQFCNDEQTCEWIGSQLATPTVRISQIYLGGQGVNSPATFKNGFIELYNYGTQQVSLANLKLLIGTNSGVFSQALNFTDKCDLLPSQNCNLAPGAYFRLKNENNPAASAGTAVSSTLSFSTNIGQNGTVAIATQLPSGATCHSVKATSVDLVGIGNSLCAENRAVSGISTADDTSRSQNAYMRKQAGQIDTADNFNDFSVETPVLH